MNNHIVDHLFEIIKDRQNSDPSSSYVASLYHQGTEKIARKVSEEAAEVLIEAIRCDRERLKSESADLIFHLMVLWADQGVKPADIFDILQSRLGQSGHDEKARR